MTLFEAVHAAFRRLRRSPRTEEAYTHWIRALIRYHGCRHPRDLTAADVTAYLNHLAVERRASASTQNQALCAIAFLYRHVLGLPMPELLGLERAQRPEPLPAVREKLSGAASSFAWQYLFPASRPCLDPATGRPVLHHIHETAVQKAVTAAARAAGIDKRVHLTLNARSAWRGSRTAWERCAHDSRRGIVSRRAWRVPNALGACPFDGMPDNKGSELGVRRTIQPAAEVA